MVDKQLLQSIRDQELQPPTLREPNSTSSLDKFVITAPSKSLETASIGEEIGDMLPVKKRQLSIAETIQRKHSYSDGGKVYYTMCKNLLYLICVDKRPFDIVKGRGFKKFMHQICPSFKIPSVDTLKEHLDAFYSVMRSKIETTFDNVSHVAITCDIWSEMMTTTSYLGVTAHYLENNKIVSRCIATVALDQRHTGDYISEKLKEICLGIHIRLEKITAVVTDNGANMVSGVSKFLNKNKHLPCFAHTINLIAESILSVENFNLLVNKIREIVKFFKLSVIQSDLLRQKQTGVPRKLILDVKTRWNSVYYMLERYIELAPYVHQILMLNTKAPPTPSALEMKNIKLLLNILKPLEHITKELSGEQYVTISKVIPMVNCLKAQIIGLSKPDDSTDDSSIADAVKNELLKQMQRRFGQIEDNHLAALSCLLDPRFKNIHFEEPKACAKAISMIRQLISTNHSADDGGPGTSSSEPDSDSSAETTYDFWSHHKTLAHTRQKKKSGVGSHNTSSNENDEMSLYLATPVSPLTTNPLEQWEDMKLVFPQLYKLAHEYLLIPATSVPSERLFSKAGSTLSKTRNRLSAKRLDKILFLSDCTEEEWEV